MKIRNKNACAGSKPRLLPMDELRCRPCMVEDRPALFHRWIDDDRAVLHVDARLNARTIMKANERFRTEGVVSPGFHIDVLRETFALVEYRDGKVAKVKPELVHFVVEEG